MSRIHSRIGFEPFLRLAVGMPETAFDVIRDVTLTFWGFGADGLSLAEMLDYPVLGPGLRRGAQALGKTRSAMPDTGVAYPDEPYIFHFPDGNAGIARLLVRSLVPGRRPGARHGGRGARAGPLRPPRPPGERARIRLSSTAVEVAHARGGVDVVYVRGGHVERVCARHVVLACWNNVDSLSLSRARRRPSARRSCIPRRSRWWS
jgi:spermidine dehydrogenase